MSQSKRIITIRTVPSNCSKIAFASKADARRYIKKHRGAAGFTAKHSYECREDPNHWHITTQQASA